MIPGISPSIDSSIPPSPLPLILGTQGPLATELRDHGRIPPRTSSSFMTLPRVSFGSSERNWTDLGPKERHARPAASAGLLGLRERPVRVARAAKEGGRGGGWGVLAWRELLPEASGLRFLPGRKEGRRD